jgi:phosphoglycolate phosphatase-like HAD superfamily hydrolase
MARAVVFDLDALLDLSAIAAERRGARWKEMAARLAEVVGRTAPHGTLAMSELPEWAMESGCRVGIHTDLPQSIAEPLVERFDLACEELVDASGGFPAGPDPAAIETIADRLGVDGAEMLVLGSSPADFGAAANAGARSAGVAGVGKDWNGWRPDIGVRSADEFVEAIENGAAMRPIAEVLAEGEAPATHWGSLLRVATDAFAAGRHFSATDRRLAGHELSKLILRAKEDPTAAQRLGAILGEAAGLEDLPGADLVVSGPVVATPAPIASRRPAPGWPDSSARTTEPAAWRWSSRASATPTSIATSGGWPTTAASGPRAHSTASGSS